MGTDPLCLGENLKKDFLEEALPSPGVSNVSNRQKEQHMERHPAKKGAGCFIKKLQLAWTSA